MRSKATPILPAYDQNDTTDYEVSRIACAIITNHDYVKGERRVYGSQLLFIEDYISSTYPGGNIRTPIVPNPANSSSSQTPLSYLSFFQALASSYNYAASFLLERLHDPERAESK